MTNGETDKRTTKRASGRERSGEQETKRAGATTNGDETSGATQTQVSKQGGQAERSGKLKSKIELTKAKSKIEIEI